MRKIALTLTVAIVAINIFAQPMAPVKEGMSLVYAFKDNKDKIKNYSRQTVTSVTGSGNNLTVTYTSEVLDAKKKTSDKNPVITYTMRILNGDVILDIKSILNSVATSSPVEGSAEGTPMIIPANMKAGDKLSDGEMKMQIAIVKISALYTNGVCEVEEQVTTQAGTFFCKKTKYDCRSSAMGLKKDIVVHTWYAPGIGVVKQNLFNNKGKLESSQELIEVNN